MYSIIIQKFISVDTDDEITRFVGIQGACYLNLFPEQLQQLSSSSIRVNEIPNLAGGVENYLHHPIIFVPLNGQESPPKCMFFLFRFHLDQTPPQDITPGNTAPELADIRRTAPGRCRVLYRLSTFHLISKAQLGVTEGFYGWAHLEMPFCN